MAINPIRESLKSGKFFYMVEMVASATAREAQLMQTASDIAGVSEITAASITSYAGGAAGHDPVRVGTAVRARGLPVNIHLTCVNKDRLSIHNTLQDLAALGIENVFAISGDYPKGADPSSTVFDLDSVQLIEMISEVRQHAKIPFLISGAVSPFKYVEADCAYQYLKLEKKIAAGLDFAITQLGYDSRKFRELKRYLDERGLKTPVLGNVYILNGRAAEKMSKGEPPGCWVSKELLERIQEETKSEDKGMAARLERAAKMVAIVRGLGFAGAYLGGDSKAERLKWVIKRSEELAPKWEELAEEISYAPKGGFYFYETPKAAAKPRPFSLTASETMHSLLFAKQEPIKSLMTGIVKTIDNFPGVAHALERVEYAFKAPAYGCQACGNCVLPDMEYVCPQTCPKGMRNGPCGGTLMGRCEVHDMACIWVSVYDRAKANNHIDQLKTFIPAPNRALKGTSSWINYFLDRDVRPGHPGQIIQIDPLPESLAPPAPSPKPEPVGTSAAAKGK